MTRREAVRLRSTRVNPPNKSSRPSRPGRCARHGALAPRRGLLAGCRGAHRGPRSRRAGAAAALLCPPALCAGAPRAARPRPTRLSLPQAPTRWAHRAAPHAGGIDRPAGRADPAPASRTATAITGCWQRARRSAREVTALARPATPPSPAPLPAGDPAQRPARSPARILWALLLARIYEIFPLRCTLCGGEMRLIAFVTDAAAVKTILGHWGQPTSPPEVAPARGPPLWDQAPEPRANWDDAPAPVPAFVFDQRLGW